jgi:hypothetical protein
METIRDVSNGVTCYGGADDYAPTGLGMLKANRASIRIGYRVIKHSTVPELEILPQS